MKTTFIALATLVLWPWAVGLVDMIALVATGGPVTPISWGNPLVWFALLVWPMVWIVGLMTWIAWSSNE